MSNRTFLLLFAVLCAWPSAARAQIPSDSVVLRPGDVVRINVWRHPDFSGEFPIDAAGNISHPLFKSLHVAGVPLATAENDLQTLLKQYDAQPAFTFVPLIRVFVLGEVRQPNSLTVPPGTTMAQAIALAGGPTNDADLHHVTLVRDSASTAMDFSKPETTMGRQELHSGDELLVRHKGSFFRDDLVPMASLVAAFVSIANFVRR